MEVKEENEEESARGKVARGMKAKEGGKREDEGEVMRKKTKMEEHR